MSSATQDLPPDRPLVGIATCADLPAGDEDAALINAALGEAAISSEWVIWSDLRVDWARFDLVVIRSTWDYTAARAEYLEWATGVPRLHNPVNVLAWNSDKTYLRDISAAGIATVPTQWIEPGQEPSSLAGEFVLKPTVGAGSKGAGRFNASARGAGAAAAQHLATLHAAGRTVMVQPYLGDVDTDGEAALVYFGGQFSHAITKRAMLAPDTVNALDPGYSRSLYVPERISARIPSAAELEMGERVIAYLCQRFGELVYARVDLLPTPNGPVVIELELTEPSLFLRHDPSSAKRLAAAIAGLLPSR